jgi:hypothetical protein
LGGTQPIATFMKKALLVSTGVLVAIVVAGLVWAAVHVDNYFGKPFATFTTTSGEVGDLRIGESKHDILQRLTAQSFSVDPKPSECPIAWIEVATMSDVYRTCLLTSNKWEEGHASTSGLCKGPSDANTMLSFRDNRLASVTTECWHPQ